MADPIKDWWNDYVSRAEYMAAKIPDEDPLMTIAKLKKDNERLRNKIRDAEHVALETQRKFEAWVKHGKNRDHVCSRAVSNRDIFVNHGPAGVCEKCFKQVIRKLEEMMERKEIAQPGGRPEREVLEAGFFHAMNWADMMQHVNNHRVGQIVELENFAPLPEGQGEIRQADIADGPHGG